MSAIGNLFKSVFKAFSLVDDVVNIGKALAGALGGGKKGGHATEDSVGTAPAPTASQQQFCVACDQPFVLRLEVDGQEAEVRLDPSELRARRDLHLSFGGRDFEISVSPDREVTA